jgi:RimJ/RimL family protein N-acetyltransferase
MLRLAGKAPGRSGRVSSNVRPHSQPFSVLTTLLTNRLRLEPFSEEHLLGLNAMNSRPEVMRFLSGQPETLQQTAAGIARVQRCWSAWGTSWWAFVDLNTGRIAGAGCVQYLRKEAVPPDDPMSLLGSPLEIGWRLHPDFWRQGLATEAAHRMTAFAFERFDVDELLAVRNPENLDSARVMDRLSMSYRGLEQWYGTTVAVHALSRLQWQQLHPHLSEA